MGLISERAPLMTEAYQRVQEFRFKFYFKIDRRSLLNWLFSRSHSISLNQKYSFNAICLLMNSMLPTSCPCTN